MLRLFNENSRSITAVLRNINISSAISIQPHFRGIFQALPPKLQGYGKIPQSRLFSTGTSSRDTEFKLSDYDPETKTYHDVSEIHLIGFFDLLEGDKNIDIEQKLKEDPCFILKQQIKIMTLSPVIKILWEQLENLENKHIKLKEPLHTRMKKTAEAVNNSSADPSVEQMTCTSQQIEKLFPDASQDFKHLMLYLGGYMAMIGYFNFVASVTNPKNAIPFTPDSNDTTPKGP